MEVLVIQPPSPRAVTLDRCAGRAARPAPPWEPLCLLSFLRQRSRHTGRVFDARVRTNWRDDLAHNLAVNEPPHLAVIHCDRHDEEAVRETVAALRSLRPDLPLAGFGALPTNDPANFRTRLGFDFALIGDPEPTLRHLLDDYSVAFRRQRIPALAQEGVGTPAPLWMADLKALAMPDWHDVSFTLYDARARDTGLRVDMQLTRGADNHPLSALQSSAASPLRTGQLERFAEALQECAHLGVNEVRFTDAPEIWETGLINEWLARLLRVKNVQDWSLRLLALPVSENFRNRLVDTRCRRIEMLVPTCNTDLAETLRYDAPTAGELLETIHWFEHHGVIVDLIFWTGGPDEPRGEAHRILRFLRALRHPPFALEARPDVAPNAPHVAAIARTVRRRIRLSPTPWLRKIFTRVKNAGISLDREQRDLLVRPRGIPQAITGTTDFLSTGKTHHGEPDPAADTNRE